MFVTIIFQAFELSHLAVLRYLYQMCLWYICIMFGEMLLKNIANIGRGCFLLDLTTLIKIFLTLLSQFVLPSIPFYKYFNHRTSITEFLEQF